MALTFLDANGLNEYNQLFKKSIGLDSNETDSVVQISNKAEGNACASFGSHNFNLSDSSFCQGTLNITGAMLNSPVNGIIEEIVLNDNNCTVITIAGNISSEQILQENAVVVYVNGYYFPAKIKNKTLLNNAIILELYNHNIANECKNIINLNEVIIYSLDHTNISDDCFSEHLEGAYNISGATGDGANSSRVSHIEGHTNSSFGQYNHIEGVRNRALGKTEMVHIEGRYNTVEGDANPNNVLASHIEGSENIVKNSSYTHVGGFKNTVSDSDKSFVYGEGLVVNTPSQIVMGTYNEENPEALFILAGGTSSEPKNLFEVSKQGEVLYHNAKGKKVSVNETEAALREEIETITLEPISTSNVTSEYFFDLSGSHFKANNVSKVTVVSRNILNSAYVHGLPGSSKTVEGLEFTNNQGSLRINGFYTPENVEKPAWPQYYLHREDNNKLDLIPGHTYTIGAYCSGIDATNSFDLKFNYEVSEGSGETSINCKKGAISQFTWREGYVFKSLFVQASKTTYDSAVVYPYIIDTIYAEAKPMSTWIPYQEAIYNNPTQIIELEAPIDAYLRIEGFDNTSTVILYKEKEIASKEYVDEKFADLNIPDTSIFATKEEVASKANANHTHNLSTLSGTLSDTAKSSLIEELFRGVDTRFIKNLMYGNSDENFEYSYNEDNSAVITKYSRTIPSEGTEEECSVTIPETFCNCPISAFKDTFTFKGADNIKSITFNNSIKNIPNNFLKANGKITGDLLIPDSVETIGSYAFSACNKLSKVSLGKNLKTVGSRAFESLGSLQYLIIKCDNMNNLSSQNLVFAGLGRSAKGGYTVVSLETSNIPNYLFYPYDDSKAPFIKLGNPTLEDVSIGESSFQKAYIKNQHTITLNKCSIGKNAFNNTHFNNNNLILRDCSVISQNAFANSTGLKKIAIQEIFNTKAEENIFEYVGAESAEILYNEQSNYNKIFNNIPKVTLFGENNTLGQKFQGNEVTELLEVRNFSSLSQQCFKDCILSHLHIFSSTRSEIAHNFLDGCTVYSVHVPFIGLTMDDRSATLYDYLGSNMDGINTIYLVNQTVIGPNFFVNNPTISNIGFTSNMKEIHPNAWDYIIAKGMSITFNGDATAWDTVYKTQIEEEKWYSSEQLAAKGINLIFGNPYSL